MFCPKCGAQLPEDATFCSSCGEVMTAAPAQEPVASTQEPTVSEVAVPAAKKKGKKLPLILGIAGGFVAVVAILAVVFYGQMQGFILKTFGSSDDYYKYVETMAAEKSSNGIAQLYGVANNEYMGDVGKEIELKVNLSDEAHNLISNYAEIDLSWLKNATVSMRTETKNGNTKALASITASDTDVANVVALIDSANGEGYFTIKGMTDYYLGFDAYGIAPNEIYSDAEFKEALPTDEELKELLKKYLLVAVNSVDNVEKDTKTINVGGIEEKVTVLTLHIDEEAVEQIADAMLKEIEKDNQIKGYIEDVAEYLANKGYISDENADAAYEEFLKGVEKGLKSMVKSIDVEDDEDLITITNYVNSSHKIVGRIIEVEGHELLSYKIASKKNDFALYAEADNTVISGTGTRSGAKVSGSFDIEVEGTALLELELEEFDMLQFKQGNPQGTVKLSITDEGYKLLALPTEVASVITLLDPTLCLQFDCDEDSDRIVAALQNKDKEICSFEVSVKSVEPGEIEMPDENDVCPEEYFEEWMNTVDMMKLFQKLSDAGVPNDQLTQLQNKLLNS